MHSIDEDLQIVLDVSNSASAVDLNQTCIDIE